MPRKPRMYVAGVPSHVVQRGNNRDICFHSDQDYRFYLDCLGDACRRYAVSLHAYVLMTNHVHLLMTPSDATGISSVMQSLGRRYVQYFNFLYQRSGTLWESRHKASLIDSERYLLSCYRYIELNPVRAKMVYNPEDYVWSSYKYNAFGESEYSLTPHEQYLALGQTPARRQQHYRALFDAPLAQGELHAIRSAAKLSMPLGDERFTVQLESVLGRSIGFRRQGRPWKRKAKCE